MTVKFFVPIIRFRQAEFYDVVRHEVRHDVTLRLLVVIFVPGKKTTPQSGVRRLTVVGRTWAACVKCLYNQ